METIFYVVGVFMVLINVGLSVFASFLSTEYYKAKEYTDGTIFLLFTIIFAVCTYFVAIKVFLS